MSSHAIISVLFFLLCTGSVLCLLLAILYPRIAAGYPFNRRLELISVAGSAAKLKGNGETSRKRSVEETLREAEERAAASAKKTKPSLAARLRQAQLNWSKGTYYLVCLIGGLAAFLLILGSSGLGRLPALGFSISSGLLLPHLYVNFRRRRRFKRFTAELADAVDIVVRGVKVGLPLVECFKIVATEAHSPVKEEFKLIVEDQTLGLPLGDATDRLPDRVPIAEARFFAIVISMQSRTGGSLSEALGNLSKVLRDRRKMQEKVKALSGESKASAGIIGAIPVFVAAALFVTAPDYVGLLVTTHAGNIVLAVCAVWMLIGTMVMRKMINFDI
jgi:tight adherence protein B